MKLSDINKCFMCSCNNMYILFTLHNKRKLKQYVRQKNIAEYVYGNKSKRVSIWTSEELWSQEGSRKFLILVFQMREVATCFSQCSYQISRYSSEIPTRFVTREATTSVCVCGEDYCFSQEDFRELCFVRGVCVCVDWHYLC